jgi:uncharacterized protein (TIGR02145 family)
MRKIKMRNKKIILVILLGLGLTGLQAQSPPIIKDIDGTIYHAVTIGKQVWMIENLQVGRYRNGDSIPNVTDDNQWSELQTGAYCDYKNIPGNSMVYGKLYNWYSINDKRGIAPKGWHVPSVAEWTTLATYLGKDSIAGGKIKETGATHWQSPNTGATNTSGFTALPGGYCNYQGFCHDLEYYGNWWSTKEVDSRNAEYRFVYWSSPVLYIGAYFKSNGLSVRCLKD